MQIIRANTIKFSFINQIDAVAKVKIYKNNVTKCITISIV